MKGNEIVVSIQPRALRSKSAAAYLGIARTYLNVLVQRGELAPRCIGRARVFLREDLDAFLESQPARNEKAVA